MTYDAGRPNWSVLGWKKLAEAARDNTREAMRQLAEANQRFVDERTRHITQLEEVKAEYMQVAAGFMRERDEANAALARAERDNVSLPTDRQRVRQLLEALGDSRALSSQRKERLDEANAALAEAKKTLQRIGDWPRDSEGRLYTADAEHMRRIARETWLSLDALTVQPDVVK